MAMKVQIDKMRRLTKGNSKLKGSCSVILADGRITINDVTVVEGRDGLFVSLPQKQWEDKDGKKRYTNVVYIRDEADLTAIKDAVLNAFESGEKPRKKEEQLEEPAEGGEDW